MEPWIVQIVAIGSATTVALAFTALKGLSIWVKRKELENPDQVEQIADLEQRVAELEERADFAERLLGDQPARRIGRPVDTPV